MKRNLILPIAIFVAAVFSVQSVSAQITINIPEVKDLFKKKKKKEETKTESQKTEQTKTEEANNNQPQNQSQESQTSAVNQDSRQTFDDDDVMDNARHETYLQELKTNIEQVQSYTKETKWIMYIKKGDYDYGYLAVSKVAREKFFKDVSFCEKHKKMMIDGLDSLAAMLAQKLPSHRHNLAEFKFHTPAHDAMLKNKFYGDEPPADYKIIQVGFKQSNWIIEKNSLGIPLSRYKQGVVYYRYLKSTHPYCFLSYGNVSQDYAGGGTYGATYVEWFNESRTLVGCPAGTK